MLTKNMNVDYKGDSQSLTTGGRCPFSSDNSANNRIALSLSNSIALFKALNGGRSSILRDMGASTSCDVTIPATFFSSQKRGELINNWRLTMSNTQALSKIDVTDLYMSALYAKLKIGFVQEILTRSFINEEIQLSHSGYEGLALVMEDINKQMEEITNQLDSLACERRGL